ncbi:MAG: hypothetical protein GX295_10185 [Syntrophomonadaceae bacterium]|jgi:ABC-type Na+ efflux pump permease subunit|nr:hypothetical protein [Syntrophomonadaceae bacterium]
MKIYHGIRENYKPYVTVQEEGNPEIKNLKHFVKHNPVSMDWGNGGAGAADLAWSLLIDVYGTDTVDFVEFIYQRFKREVVVDLPQGDWTMTSAQVKEAVDQYKKVFDEEYTQAVTINSKFKNGLVLSATGSVDVLIKLSDEIRALASQTGEDLTNTNLGGLYYGILQHCESMKQRVLDKIEN